MAKNPYINIYGGDVTAGEKDGTPISCDGSFSFPISAIFDIAKPDYTYEDAGVMFKVFKLAIRTEDGFNTGTLSDDKQMWIRVTDTGYNAYHDEANLRLSWYPRVYGVDDANWNWYIAKYYAEITDVNTLFYLRVRYKNGDNLSSYRNSKFHVIAKIFPV